MMEVRREPLDGPMISEFKGAPTLSIPVGTQNTPFSFGFRKAEAILKYIEDIQKFYDNNKDRFQK